MNIKLYLMCVCNLTYCGVQWSHVLQLGNHPPTGTCSGSHNGVQPLAGFNANTCLLPVRVHNELPCQAAGNACVSM